MASILETKMDALKLLKLLNIFDCSIMGLLSIKDNCDNLTTIQIVFKKLELVCLPEGKYWVYPRMVYKLAIVIPRDNVWLEEFPK